MERFLFIENPCLLALVAACLPLLAFAEIMIFSKPGKGSSTAIAYSWLSLLLSVYVFILTWDRGDFHQQLTWFSIGEMRFAAGILLNNLSVLMLLLISLVSFLVHIYSSAYMKDDPALHRYWAYLGLFCFAMMALVIADNLLLVYMFWELVGVSSYLLIGFWTSKESAAKASKKAFLMNRIGDLGFLAALFIIYVQFQTLDISSLFGQHDLVRKALVYNGLWITSTSQLPVIWLSVAGAGFFLGAMAKSAQFPLHTWLPDAMEGPTPVSSLIHAATMVAAGVFLLVRVAPVFNDTVLLIISTVGAVTAFFAATCALVQQDIKRILAWSTVSQLGLMMLAVGTGATGAAVFHLSTHAFFKCLLFLCAGSVIHALSHRTGQNDPRFDPQDIGNMGGLRKTMPFTFAFMLIAACALSGLPLFSGFLSKDAILVHLFEWSESRSGIAVLFPYLAFSTSIFTTFYIARLIVAVFFGPVNEATGTAHESPSAMKWPMAVLALACFYPLFTGGAVMNSIPWIMSGFPVPEINTVVKSYHLMIPLAVTAGNLLAIVLAWLLYGKKLLHKTTVPGKVSRFLQNGWYLDRLYERVIIQPVVYLSSFSFTFDRYIIDGAVGAAARTGLLLSQLACLTDGYVIDPLVNFAGTLSKTIGNFARRFQSGRIQYYLAVSLAVLLIYFIIKYLA